ncbi:MAG: hypothetical protein IQL11_01745 [Bacteroidales bacterium]|nr:hypothetical protein [Bacteroidales bacterium]
MNFNYSVYRSLLRIIVTAIVIFLFTFPEFGPDFGAGLDNSYAWAFNYLFAGDYGRLVELIYPFGPLGFLKIPLVVGSNFAVGLIFFSILKLLFILSLLHLFTSAGKQEAGFILPALMTLIVSYFCDIDLAVTGLTTILSFSFLRKNNPHLIAGAVIAATLGLFIKSSIGIISFTVVIGSLVIHYLNNRNAKLLFLPVVINLLIFHLLGLLVFRSIGSFYGYLIGVTRLTAGYSTALAVYPENSWTFLGIFILTVISFPFLIKDRESRILYFLMIIPLFMIWKHAMSREDITHSRVMLYFLFFFWGILAGTSKEKSVLLFLVPVISILAFYRNMSNLERYSGYKIEISGINHFYNAVIGYREMFQRCKEISEANISQNRLDSETRTIIGNSTIDFYPWELSYVPANDLNWQPRKTLQSGSYSRWLDRKSSLSFEQNKGPEFILLHYIGDQYGGRFGSIDGRYLFNEEPLTLYNILRNYSVIKTTDTFVLLAAADSARLAMPEISGRQNIGWDEWIDVPDFGRDIGRVRFFSRPDILGKIKLILYKGEAYYIDYQLNNNMVLTYRFNPVNARDGLWINPMYRDSLSADTAARVQKIRFRNSAPGLVRRFAGIEFETIRRIE